MRSKAFRRQQHQRMIQKTEKFQWLQPQYWHGDEEHRQKMIRQVAENRKPCSCYMCGNARKMWKQKTMQEKKMDIASHDWDDFIK